MNYTSNKLMVPPVTTGAAYFQLLRPHQWLKNILVFLPLTMAHVWTTPKIMAALIAFTSFCMCASAGYILNDILDREHDRAHPKKQMRPLASGAIPLPHAIGMLAALLCAAFLLALLLPIYFLVVLGAYFLATAAYSTFLKRKLLLDVIILAGLYGLRVVAGAVACDVPLSQWLIAFCFFIFLSLALIKRTTELVSMPPSEDDIVVGRGYQRSDLTPILVLSGVSAFVSVLVFTLYINSEHIRVLYSRPDFMWGVAVVLVYWLSRTLVLAARGGLDQDPVVFALTDRASLIVGLVAVVFVLVAL